VVDLLAPDIVSAARGWLGTPHHDQASVKGVGCDCAGLVAGVARECGLAELGRDLIDAMHSYNPTKIDEALLKIGLGRHMDRITDIEPGAVLLWKVGRPLKAQHLAIASHNGRMIHCWGKGPNKVIEVPVGVGRLELLDSVWRFRGLAHA
jgi:NlpC/P60 family putative phage cell wall peptidase